MSFKLNDMKYIVYLVILFLGLTSCSEWKYSNGIGRSKKIVYRESQSSYSKTNESSESEIALKDEVDSITPSEIVFVEQPLNESLKEAIFPSIQPNNKSLRNETELRTHADEVSPADSLEEDDEVDPAVLSNALDAERKGKQSRNIGIASLVVTLVFVLFFPGFILAIISLIKGINSLRAPYNTPQGVSMARTGILLSSISLILYLLAFLLLLSIILLFI